jgi:hypothetical protein
VIKAINGFKTIRTVRASALTKWKMVAGNTRSHKGKRGAKLMLVNGEVILENVRRYRAIASLYRQTAAFRPHQRCSLLDQADEWEHFAVVELEAYFKLCDSPTYNLPPGGHSARQHAMGDGCSRVKRSSDPAQRSGVADGPQSNATPIRLSLRQTM